MTSANYRKNCQEDIKAMRINVPLFLDASHFRREDGKLTGRMRGYVRIAMPKSLVAYALWCQTQPERITEDSKGRIVRLDDSGQLVCRMLHSSLINHADLTCARPGYVIYQTIFSMLETFRRGFHYHCAEWFFPDHPLWLYNRNREVKGLLKLPIYLVRQLRFVIDNMKNISKSNRDRLIKHCRGLDVQKDGTLVWYYRSNGKEHKLLIDI